MRCDRTISWLSALRLGLTSLLLPLVLVPAPAEAVVVSSTPTLPALGSSFTSTTGIGCFPLAGVCASPGRLTFGASTSSFNFSGQDIVSNVTYIGVLTDLANTPIGPLTLTGTIEQEVLGRTFSTETGTWTTELTSLSLSGPVLGDTLTVALDTSHTSSGTTSIVPVGDGTFRIDSFFDVFVELTLDGVPPLTVNRGPLELVLSPVAAVPEPSTWAMMILGFAGIGFMNFFRRKSKPSLMAI
jgi:hypothetical protein